MSVCILFRAREQSDHETGVKNNGSTPLCFSTFTDPKIEGSLSDLHYFACVYQELHDN